MDKKLCMRCEEMVLIRVIYHAKTIQTKKCDKKPRWGRYLNLEKNDSKCQTAPYLLSKINHFLVSCLICLSFFILGDFCTFLNVWFCWMALIKTVFDCSDFWTISLLHTILMLIDLRVSLYTVCKRHCSAKKCFCSFEFSRHFEWSSLINGPSSALYINDVWVEWKSVKWDES